MHDIIDVIKNLQTLSEDNNAFNVLKDFERVLDELDIYVFKNWEEGELISGPNIKRYSVSCKFMWDEKEMPDPAGGKLLTEYGCEVVYSKEKVLVPRKIKDPSDYRPGTKKGKIDAHPVWMVTIEIPKKLMQDVSVGKENNDNAKMSEIMRYNNTNSLTTDSAAQESPQQNVQQPTT